MTAKPTVEELGVDVVAQHWQWSGEGDGTMFLQMKWKGKHDLWGGYAEVPGTYTLFPTRPEDAPMLWSVDHGTQS